MKLSPRQPLPLGAISLAAVMMIAGCSDTDSSGPPAARPPGPGPAPLAPELIMDETTPAPGIPMSFPDGVVTFQEADGEWIYFNEANRQRRVLISSIGSASLIHDIALDRASDGGRDANGQICEDAEGNRIFGEDTGQGNDDPVYAGWGVFDENYKQVGKLTPTNISTDNQSEPFGCGLARDGSGRLFTAEVGTQAQGASTGQLIVWFPDPDNGFRVWPGGVPADRYPNSNFSDNYCKLAIDLSTASSVAVDADNNVYVANAGNSTVVVFHPPFPTGPNAAGGCSGTDGGNPAAGIPAAPMVDPALGDPLDREVFIDTLADTFAAEDRLISPSGIVQSPTTGNWYVSGVFDGKILEYSPDGKTVYQAILDPADNVPPESPFAPDGLPLSTGHPFGLALDSQDNLYYTDMQLSGTLPSVGPSSGKGKLWRIRFEDTDSD